MALSKFIDELSSDSDRMFTIVDANILVGMLNGQKDCDRLTRIIRKYIPNAAIRYEKTHNSREDTDIYIIRLVNYDRFT